MWWWSIVVAVVGCAGSLNELLSEIEKVKKKYIPESRLEPLLLPFVLSFMVLAMVAVFVEIHSLPVNNH